MPRRCSSTYSGCCPAGSGSRSLTAILEAAVVCRQSGCLASHICPDRDTLMIPRTAAAGEVCPYHRIVNLSRDLRYRVTADCYDPAQIVRMPMFILPPAQEWYYRKQHPDYRPLPPLHPGLSGSGAGGNPIDIVYPQPGRVLVAPKSLEGEAQSPGLHGHTPRPQCRVILAYRRQLYRCDDPRTQDIRPSRSRCAPADRYRQTRGAAKRLVQLPLTAACGFFPVQRGFPLGAAQGGCSGPMWGLPGGLGLRRAAPVVGSWHPESAWRRRGKAVRRQYRRDGGFWAGKHKNTTIICKFSRRSVVKKGGTLRRILILKTV